jgi:hypothetical protein
MGKQDNGIRVIPNTLKAYQHTLKTLPTVCNFDERVTNNLVAMGI